MTSDRTVEKLRELYSSKWLSNDELKRLERESGLPFKRGKFGRGEQEICMRALEEYLNLINLNRQEFIDMMFVRNNEKRTAVGRTEDKCKDFFVTVAGRLDGRPVVNVYHYLRRRLHPSNTGELWTAEEDAELKSLHLLHGPQWERIGREMGRFHVACRDRFRKIQASYSRGPWTEDEVRRLEQAHARAMSADKPEGVAAWTFISDQVGTRSASQCQWKWTETVMFRSMHPEKKRVNWTIAEDRLLVNSIYDLGIEHPSEIVWSTLCRDGPLAKFTPARVRHRWQLLQKRLRNSDRLPIDDICEALMRDLAPLSPDLITDSETD